MKDKITYDHWSDNVDFSIDDHLKGSMEVLEWAYNHYGDDIVYACSFGAEGMVLIDLISKVKKNAEIVFLDTNLHFKETYDLIEETKQRYPKLTIKLQQPDLTLNEQKEQYGDKLWETNPNQCCHIRKIEPLTKGLGDKSAWISGLRREQSPTRKHVNFLNQDDKFNKIKICPLIHWTWKDVWRYLHKNDLPYNKLHDQGYPSIGCEMCTAPAFNMNDLRSGRWTGNDKLECGLHQT